MNESPATFHVGSAESRNAAADIPGAAADGARLARAAKWAERDARRDAHEAQMAQQAADHRAQHVATVYQAYVALWPTRTRDEMMPYAEAAVDALMESGVVFARLGSWDDDE